MHKTCFLILQFKQIHGHCLPQTRPEYRSEIFFQEMLAFLHQFTKHSSSFLLLAHSLGCPHVQRSGVLQHACRATVIRSSGNSAESELQWREITGYSSEGTAHLCCNYTELFRFCYFGIKVCVTMMIFTNGFYYFNILG